MSEQQMTDRIKYLEEMTNVLALKLQEVKDKTMSLVGDGVLKVWEEDLKKR